jgi:hypothetical protein
MTTCIVCGRPIKHGFWLCYGCKTIYGNFATWPAWLKGLRNIERANRRHAEASGENEVIFVPLDDESCDGRQIRPTPELRTA